METVVEQYPGPGMSTVIHLISRRRGPAEGATTLRQSIFHFMHIDSYLHSAAKNICVLPNSICMNRSPVYGLYIVNYVLNKSSLTADFQKPVLRFLFMLTS